MVRINLISPKKLADQHLIAEYNEILMLLGHVRKFPEVRDQPEKYKLGKGHINFFKDKLIYLKRRFHVVSLEMRKRGFKTRKDIKLESFDRKLRNDWNPSGRDFKIIKGRLRSKLREKPGYYRYYKEKKSLKFFLNLLG